MLKMEEKSYIGWDKIDDLGKEYYSLVQAGFGLTPETRSKRQIELANMIISNSRDYIYKLAHRLIFQGGCRIARGRLSLSHERKRISPNNCQIEKEMCIGDLANAASVDMIKGMDNYDPSKGSLRNFIYYHAIGSMYREASQKLGLVRLPTSAHECIRKLRKNYYHSKLIKALSEKFGSTHSAELAYLGITGEYCPLNQRNQEGKNLDEKIEDINAIIADDEIINNEIMSCTMKTLHCLLPIEQKIIEMHLGLNGCKDKTLQEIGDELGLSRARIHQLESRGFEKIRKILSK